MHSPAKEPGPAQLPPSGSAVGVRCKGPGAGSRFWQVRHVEETASGVAPRDGKVLPRGSTGGRGRQLTLGARELEAEGRTGAGPLRTTRGGSGRRHVPILSAAWLEERPGTLPGVQSRVTR